MNIAYLRVSRDKQDTENQRYEIEKYCVKEGITIHKWIEEKVTGKRKFKERKAGEIFEIAEQGDSIIMADMTRLGRSMFDSVDTMRQIIEEGLRLKLVKESIVLEDTPMSKMVFTMLAGFAEMERERISQRTKVAIRRKIRDGQKWGRKEGFQYSYLDEQKDKIIKAYKEYPHFPSLSQTLSIPESTLRHFIKKHL